MQQLQNARTKDMAEQVERSMNNYMQFQNSSYYAFQDGFIEEDFNLFRDRYYASIMPHTEMRILSDEELKKYKYRPKRLSSDLYGSTDYWYILLMINDMYSPFDFKKKNVLVLTYKGTEVIREIYKKEEDDIEVNKRDVGKAIDEYNKDLQLLEE